MSQQTWDVGFTETGQRVHAMNPDTLEAPCGALVWPAEALGLTPGDVTCKKCQKATRIAKEGEV